MKAAELIGKSTDQLQDQVQALKKEQFNLRFQKATGQLENSSRVRQVRRDIARLLTVLRGMGVTRSSSAPMAKPDAETTVAAAVESETAVARRPRKARAARAADRKSRGPAPAKKVKARLAKAKKPTAKKPKARKAAPKKSAARKPAAKKKTKE